MRNFFVPQSLRVFCCWSFLLLLVLFLFSNNSHCSQGGKKISFKHDFFSGKVDMIFGLEHLNQKREHETCNTASVSGSTLK